MASNNNESNNFSSNLKTLCSYYKSISDVCRKTNINRQQFNRYLNGNTFPSYSNLKTICDFFGVDQEEIIKDPIEFKKIISPVTESKKIDDIPEGIFAYIDILKNASKHGLDRYCGYYYRYILSGSFPGNIVKSLIKIYQKDGFFYYWHVENLTSKSPVIKKSSRFRYDGVVFMVSERIYMIELESKLKSTISETIMMPSYQHGNKNISGITCYSTSDISHQPVSSRVLHEYLGDKINIRQKLNECDLFPTDSSAISDDIKEAIFTPPLSPTDILLTN
ncbi:MULTISPECIES: helix-turn-helix domain-containing protein [Marinomonas]|uniref:helix-turn-helix domain-containing protein n=1 Tax=Marinomonas TaxID=28253 RepID=UPI0014054173|nr:helix-turn-helix transcriptional regulator [Marinomonas flavescens]